MTRHLALLSGLVLSTSLSFSMSAAAAPVVSATVPSATTHLDNITVTATRTEQRVLDVLGSVDVLTTTEIDRAQPRSAAEAVKALPNVMLENGPRSAVTQMNIRGLDDRRIGIKVDGVNRNFRGEYKGRTYFNPSILKRVEVARGGNSVLDGSGAIAGTVQYITKDAADYLDDGETRGATVGVTGASNGGMIGGNVAVYGRNDKLDALVFHETTTGGNITLGNDEELPFSELTTRQNMAKGSYKINDDAKVTATVTDYFDVGDSLSNPVRTGPAAGFSTNRRASSQVGDLKAEYAPADNDLVNVTAIASLGNTKVTEVVTQAGASFGRRDRTEFEEQNLELYNTSNIPSNFGNHAVTYGAELSKDKQTGQRPGAGRSQLYPNAKSTNTAVYVQDEMDFGRVTLTPGVRWESYELKGAANATRNEGDQVVGKFAAGYKVNPTTQTYASVSQGYRAPLLSEAYSGGGLGGPLTLVANPNLKPEESTNFEVGVKTEQKPNWTKNDGMTLTGSVFYNDLKNLIERQSVTPPFIFGYRNVEDSYTYGAEAGVAYTTPNWFANLNVGATRGENKTQDRALLGIPPLKANLQLGRQGVTTDGSTWRVAYTLEAAESQNRVPANDLLVQPSDKYAVHGVQAEYEPSWTLLGAKKTSLKVSVDNLFDTAYRPVTSFLYQPGMDVRTSLSLKF